MLRSFLAFSLVVALIVLSTMANAFSAEDLTPFFAFDNGTGRGTVSPDDQAAMLKELGYAGIGYTGAVGIPEMLAALDKHGLKMYSIYVGATLGPNGPTFDPQLNDGIAALKGRETIIWLTIIGSAPNAHEQAGEVVREIADLATDSDFNPNSDGTWVSAESGSPAMTAGAS